MASFLPFLPPHLPDALARRKRRPRPPSLTRFEAALLFSDISGFAALTQRLKEAALGGGLDTIGQEE